MTTKKRDPYLPPYKPLAKRKPYDPPAPKTSSQVPEVIHPDVASASPFPLIDLAAFERELFEARPSDAMPVIGRWLRTARLKAGKDQLVLYNTLFQQLTEFYSKNAHAQAASQTFKETVQETIADARAKLRMADKVRQRDEALLDAEIAEANRRKRIAEDPDYD